MIAKKIIGAFCFALTLLPFKVNAENEPQIGYAPFAIAHPKFDCSAFLDSIKHQKTLNIAWLYTTFGNDYKCLNKIIANPKLDIFETHLLNGPGHRKHRLEHREFLKRYSIRRWNSFLLRDNKSVKAKFLRYVKGLQKLLEKKKESTTCLISPELESNLSSKAAKTLIAWSREAFPQCLIVWNPIQKGKKTNGADFIEQHGKSPKVKSPCVVNLDGTDINFNDRLSPQKRYYRSGLKNWVESTDLKEYVKKYSVKCDVAFIWVFEYNCIDTTKSLSGFIYPSERLCDQTKVFKLIQDETKKF